MARAIHRHWQTELSSGLPRRDRRGCDYEAYVPDPLVGRSIVLDGEVAADVADAERAITELNLRASVLVDTEALARLLLRAESVASSKIEGLEVGGRRLMRAEAARELGEESSDVTAAEVLGNIDAMAWAIEGIEQSGSVTLRHLLEIHRRLLAGTRLQIYAGEIRTTQNWIGGSDFNPCSAAFVPPPPELVPELLHDLIEFCNGDLLPGVAQAALVHAQFETIHPFVDGNGRAGRALVHLVLRRRGLATRVIVPVSLILATWSQRYVTALNATRYRGSAASRVAAEGCNRWVALFAAACQRAVMDVNLFEVRTLSMERAWRDRLGIVRANSSVDLLLRALPGAPIITVKSGAALIGRSFEATNNAVERLVEADILQQVKVGRRYRAFETPDIFQAFSDLDGRLASPDGDTRVSPPVRPSPRRRAP